MFLLGHFIQFFMCKRNGSILLSKLTSFCHCDLPTLIINVWSRLWFWRGSIVIQNVALTGIPCWVVEKKGKPHPHGSKWWHLLQCDILICNALPLSLMMFIYIHIFVWKPESDHLIIIFPFSADAIFWASPFPDTQINEIPTFSGVNLILSL